MASYPDLISQANLDELRCVRGRLNSIAQRSSQTIAINRFRSVYNRRCSSHFRVPKRTSHSLVRQQSYPSIFKGAVGETKFIFHDPESVYKSHLDPRITALLKCAVGVYDVMGLLNLVPTKSDHLLNPPDYRPKQMYKIPEFKIIELDKSVLDDCHWIEASEGKVVRNRRLHDECGVWTKYNSENL